MPGKFLIWLRLPVFIIGLVSFFVFQRYLATADSFKVGMIASYSLLAFGILSTWLAAFLASSKVFSAQAKSLRFASIWQLLVLVSLVLAHLYFIEIADKGSPDSTPTRLLLAGWLLALIIGLFMGIGSEMSLREAGLGRLAEPKRVMRGSISWALIGVLLASLVAFNYAGVRYDIVKDWSYLKVTEPSDSVKNFLKTIKDDVSIALFFEKDSDAAPYVHEYFDKIANLESRVHVSRYDRDMEPVLAEKLKVRRNGSIMLMKGSELKYDQAAETINIGSKLSAAREKISKLDQEFHTALMKLTTERKTAYFITGHGEWTWKGAAQDQYRSIKRLQAYLVSQNYRVNELSYDQGLSKGTPDDASVIFLIAPSVSFLDAELEALDEFLEKGGSLFVALDVNASETGEGAFQAEQSVAAQLNVFLKKRGLEYKTDPLANEQTHARHRRNESDVSVLFTQSYSSHASVTYLSKLDENAPFVVDASGSIEIANQDGSNWQAVETIRSKPGTFNDANRNHKFDEGAEKRKIYNIAAVSEKKAVAEGAPSGRLVVLADATALSDIVITLTPANSVYFVEALNWLRLTPELAGKPESEEDVKIQHTKQEDNMLFYSSIVGIPLFILLLGFIATIRRVRVR